MVTCLNAFRSPRREPHAKSLGGGHSSLRLCPVVACAENKMHKELVTKHWSTTGTWIKNVLRGGDVFGCHSLGEGVVEVGDFF